MGSTPPHPDIIKLSRARSLPIDPALGVSAPSGARHGDRSWAEAIEDQGSVALGKPPGPHRRLYSA